MKLGYKAKKRFLISGAILICAIVLLQLFVVMPTAKRVRELSGYGTPEDNRAALRINSNDVGAYRGLADYYLSKQDYPQAVDALRQIVRVEPDDTFNSLRLGDALRKMGRRDEAIEVYQKLVQQNSEVASGAKRRLEKIKSGN